MPGDVEAGYRSLACRSAGTYSRQRGLDRAPDQLQRAVVADPEYDEARVLLAMFYWKLGQLDKAETLEHRFLH